jgi:fructokinase
MLEPMAHVDLVKVSVEELALLTGETTPEAGAATLHALGPKVIIITLGAEGIAASNGSAWVQLPAIPVAAVDTTGCGDASMAGVIASLLRDLPDLKAGMAVPEEVLRLAIRYANRCGAKAATRMGAIPSLPYASEVPID